MPSSPHCSFNHTIDHSSSFIPYSKTLSLPQGIFTVSKSCPSKHGQSKGKGEISGMNNWQVFILILCNCWWFNSSYPYTGHDSAGSIFFFLYIPYHRGAEQHLAGWDGVFRGCSAHTLPQLLLQVSWGLRRGKALCHTQPTAPQWEPVMGTAGPVPGVVYLQLYFSSKHCKHSLNPTLRVGDLLLSKTVTHK